MLGQDNLADALTISRLYAIIPITAAVLLGWELTAGALYVLAVFTDVLDGYVARKQGTAGQKGSDLDGVVDFWFSLATLAWLAVLNPALYDEHLAPVLLALAAFVAFMSVSYVRNKRVIMLHLPSAKLTTFLFGLWLPLSVFFVLPGWYVWLTAVAAVVSRAENTIRVVRVKHEA